jgi:hypothetical protein
MPVLMIAAASLLVAAEWRREPVVTMDDYPIKAFDDGISAAGLLDVLIDDDGNVESCTLQAMKTLLVNSARSSSGVRPMPPTIAMAMTFMAIAANSSASTFPIRPMATGSKKWVRPRISNSRSTACPEARAMKLPSKQQSKSMRQAR